MTEYERRTIKMAAFYIPEGMYSIEELEEMLAQFKQAKEIQDRHLKKSIGEINEDAPTP